MPVAKDLTAPDETIEYQYAYPLWVKIAGVVGLLVLAYMLYDDIRANRTWLVTMEMLVGASVGIWLVQVLRDDALYIVTNRRVMRQGSKRSPDMIITYPEISEVRVVKESLTSSGSIVVKAGDERVIRIPLPGMGRAKTEALAYTINLNRGVNPDTQSNQTSDETPDKH